ncbi:MAG: hypothetical protein E6J83_12260, partial [Deltaproteobacteria bacterium]
TRCTHRRCPARAWQRSGRPRSGPARSPPGAGAWPTARRARGPSPRCARGRSRAGDGWRRCRGCARVCP